MTPDFQNINFKAYLQLTKPGVLLGNVITVIAGFLFASQGVIDFQLLTSLLVGTTIVIASACVLNNYLDQDIDAIMTRTKSRPLITGVIHPRYALIFSIVLGIFGVVVLALFTSFIVVLIGVIGFVVYVWLYGALTKRRSVHGTLVGSISGALPILAGYVAVTGSIDLVGIILFLILFFWQEPEFYSISIYRRDEYARAKIPVISVVRGIKRTKLEILIYIIMFVASSLALFLAGDTSFVYLLVMSGLGVYWIQLAVKGIGKSNNEVWAKQLFQVSLKVLLIFCLLISINSWLP